MSEPAPSGGGGRLVAVKGRSGLVWVEGPDTISFLDGLLSQNIAELGDGEVARSLLLAPNGKLRATLFVLRGADRVGLICDAGRTEIVVADLERFKIRVDVAITVDDRDVWEVWGDQDPLLLPQSGAWTQHGSSIRFEMPFARSSLTRLVVVGEQPAAEVVEKSSLEAWRIELGEPVMGVDLTESTIAQEGVDVTTSVDFDKGCYLGQELVARIDSRGHVNRRLAGVVVDGEPVPEAGSEIIHGDKTVGTLSSSAWSERLGAGVALAMVRVEVESGAVVTVGGQEGRVADLPIES